MTHLHSRTVAPPGSPTPPSRHWDTCRGRSTTSNRHGDSSTPSTACAEAPRPHSSKLRDAGHDDIVRELEEAVVGRNPLPGMWSFQMVEAYDDGYYTDAVRIHQEALDRLAEGRRHLYEAETKERLRTRGRVGHEATPSDADGRR